MKRMLSVVATGIVAVGLAATSVNAEPVSPAAVKIVDGEINASLTGKPGSAVKGAEWFSNRRLGNCLACHENPDMKKEQFHGEVGPNLEGVADRWTESQLRAIVVDSKKVFGERTLMPAFYRDSGFYRTKKDFQGKTILSAEQVEDVVAYLMTLKEPK